MTISRKSAIVLALLATAPVAVNCLFASAQDTPQASGPIDIQADEQEFAQDHVIAKGRVRVLYGDTTIRSPIATLYRDEAGSPKQAVFTGNPVLSQGTNIIKCAKLTFNVKEAKIIAEGHAHSEVLPSAMANAAPAPAAQPNKKAPGKGENGKSASTDTESGAVAQADKLATDEGDSAAGEAKSDTAAGESSVIAGKPPAPEKPPQKIITDSDRQEFERNTGKFEADGHVHVATGDIDVDSNHLRLIYGSDSKPEAVVFTGDVTARRDKNETHADVMTYFLTTQRLQATGHVRSRVVQEKTSAEPTSSPLSALPSDPGAAYAATPMNANAKIIDVGIDKSSGPDVITIISDSQDYNKFTGRVDADGNVRLYYKDTMGVGPKVAMISNETGQAEKVIFIGRSQITQPGRRWIGDRITMMVNDRRVLAEGNTRAIIVKNPGAGASPVFLKRAPAHVTPPEPSRLAKTPTPGSNSKLAGESKTR